MAMADTTSAQLRVADAASLPAVIRAPKLLVRETLAGIITALALIPEVISFSFISGVDPKVAIVASITLGLVMSVLGGRPAMVTAAAGSVALVIGPMVKQYGVGYHPSLHPAGRRHPDRLRRPGPCPAHAFCPALGDDRLRQCAGHSHFLRAGSARLQRAVDRLSVVRPDHRDRSGDAARHRGHTCAAGRGRRGHRDRDDMAPRCAQCRRQRHDGAGHAGHHAICGPAQSRNAADRLADGAQRRVRRTAGKSADRQAGR